MNSRRSEKVIGKYPVSTMLNQNPNQISDSNNSISSNLSQNMLTDYNANDDFAKSVDEAYRVIRERKAAGGEGWKPK